MRTLFLGMMFLLLTGCSSIPSYESGNISIRTIQMDDNTLKVMLYDPQRKPVHQATLKITNSAGKILYEPQLKHRIALFHYPMRESSIFIEATDSKGNKGTRQYFQSQLREIYD